AMSAKPPGPQYGCPGRKFCVARKNRAALEARVAPSISSLAKTRAWRPAQRANEAWVRGEDAQRSDREADPIAYQADIIGSDAKRSAGEADRSARLSFRQACPAHCPAGQAPVRAFTAEARARDAEARPELAVWTLAWGEVARRFRTKPSLPR